MTVNIRQLATADAGACVALRKEMLLDAPASFGSSPEDDRGSDLAQVRKRLAGGSDHATFGAFDDAAGLIGTVGVGRHPKLKENHKASVWGMYVSPAFRRRGIARQLMEAAIAHAAGLSGVRQVQLSVSETAPGAQRLYESLGFVVWGVEPDALRVGGAGHDEVHLALRLDA